MSPKVKETNPAPEQGVLIPAEEKAPSSDISNYALVELFGHQRIVGYVTEKAMGSAVWIRVDVPDLTSSGKVIREGFTRYFSPGAVYSLTPISEEMMRKLLPAIDGTPCEARALSSRSYSREDEFS